MDWKTKLMQILECFAIEEGTWHESAWERYGVTPAERSEILEAYDQYAEQESEQ